jgi:protein-disulfide isomerase
VSNGDFPSFGPPDAPVTVTVFSDFECPFCARFAAMMRNEVLPVEGKKVRLVFRQLPLTMHPWARAAAEASVCAYEQSPGSFWSFHDFFFAHQKDLQTDNLRAKVLEYAATIPGFDRTKFQACLANDTAKAVVEKDLAFGHGNGIHATPTVFINGKQARVAGSQEMLSIVRMVEKDPSAPIPSPSSPATRRAQQQPKEIADIAKGDLPSLGPVNAPVTVAVFSDFECPFCARFAALMHDRVLPAAGSKVRMVYRYFPLPMHPWAREAAEAAECARQQKGNYFWSFHDFFFQHQGDLTSATFRRQVLDHAGSIPGLDKAKLEACLTRNAAKARIDSELAYGAANGIEATPTVFVNGKQTDVVAPEQLLTLVQELAGKGTAAKAVYHQNR